MKKRLIIAEKPAMGKEIAMALPKPHKNGQGYIETGGGIVTWCIGHIMRSYTPEEYNPEWAKWNFESLPMLPESWNIKIETTKAKQFKVIKDLLKECDSVVNAGDPGREGQLIVDEVLEYLNNKKPVQRVLLYALDAKSITTAFNNLQDNDEFRNLYEAGVCRGYADWLMGMNATRAFTLKAQKGGYKGVLSVGRVQSPTLAIVVKRDELIENFVSKDYFVVSGIFSNNSPSFSAYWKPQDTTPAKWLDEEKRLIDKNVALSLANKIKGKPAKVINYEEKSGKEAAPLPFNLSKMQIYANSKWGMSAKTVLDTCQSLYETHKLQSYPRTDCQYLPENLLGEAPEILAHIAQSNPNLSQIVAGANTSLKSGAWNDSKLGEHYGLIPTKKQADLSKLTDNERKIYSAVCESYIAQFYPACEFNTASVLIECENEHFKSNGKVITKPGWKVVFKVEEDDENKNDDESEQIFPNLQNGQTINCQDGKCSDKKTTPPPRFTEGTLIKAMTNVHTLVSDPEQKKKLREKKGIGQEATRTHIIEALLKRNLLIPKGKQIISSPAGRALVQALPKKVIDPALTAIWEDALDKIAEGKISSQIFKQKQNQWVIQLIEEAKNVQMGSIANIESKSTRKTTTIGSKGSTKSAQPQRKSKGPCPKCKTGTLYEGKTKTGKKVVGCSNWNKDPKCDYVEWPK